MNRILLFILIAFLANPCLGTTYLVDPDGGGDFTSIYAAVENAVSGDEILLSPGEHNVDEGTGWLDINEMALIIRSADGNNSTCFLNAFIGLESFDVAQPTELKDLTYSGWLVSTGADQIYVENCIFTDEFFLNEVSPPPAYPVFNFINCLFSGNRIHLESGNGTCFLDDCIIRNCGELSIFAYNSGIVKFTNTLIFDNNYKMEVYNEFFFEGCTFFGNYGDSFFSLGTSPLLSIQSSIFASNNFSTLWPSGAEPILTFNNSCFFGNSNDWLMGVEPGGNISVDPLMCDPYNDVFGLCSDSPCLLVNNGVGLIGAFGEECGVCGPVAIESKSLGSVKALYR